MSKIGPKVCPKVGPIVDPKVGPKVDRRVGSKIGPKIDQKIVVFACNRAAVQKVDSSIGQAVLVQLA